MPDQSRHAYRPAVRERLAIEWLPDSPVAEPAHAVAQVPPRLVLGIDKDLDVDFGQGLGYHLPQVIGELRPFPKGSLAALCRYQSA